MKDLPFIKLLSCCIVALSICASSPSFAKAFEFSGYYGSARSSTSHTHLFQDPYNNSPLVGNDHKTDGTPGLGVAFSFKPAFLARDYGHAFAFETVSIGIDGYNFDTSRKGLVLVNGDPQFANYTYKMDIRSSRLMIDGQLNAKMAWYGWILFAQAGAGMAWNQIDYNDLPVPGIGGLGLSLSSNTREQFAYDVGGGIKFTLSQCLQFSARYLYSHLGTMQTRTHGNFDIDKPINVKLTAQSVLLGLTYILE